MLNKKSALVKSGSYENAGGITKRSTLYPSLCRPITCVDLSANNLAFRTIFNYNVFIKPRPCPS